MIEVTLNMFNAGLATIKCRPVTDLKAFQTLVARRGHQTLLRVLDGVSGGDDRAARALRGYAHTTGFLAALPMVGFRAITYDQAVNVLRTHGLDAVRRDLSGALKGDPVQRSQLSQWLCEAAGRPAALESYEALQAVPGPSGGLRPVGRVQDAGDRPLNPTLRPSMPPPPVGTPCRVVDAQQRPAPVPTASARTQESTGAGPVARAPEPESAGAAPVAAREYDQAKAYGGRAAVTFCADETKRGNATVTIEVASGSNRVYDWANKLRFQLTAAELQLMTALLGGGLQEAHFSNHDDKWMTCAWQSGQYAGTIKLTIGKGKAAEFQPRTVQIDYSAHAPIYGLFLRRCARLLRCREADVPVRVRPAAKMYQDASAAKAARTAPTQQHPGSRTTPGRAGAHQGSARQYG